MVQDRIDLKNLFVEIRRKGSTSQVSRELDVSMGNISDWKNGRSVPNAVSLVKLADYFGCSVDYLLGRTENRDMIETGGLHHERDCGFCAGKPQK